MRSETPKVLHELCGLPMVLWPVRAALAAGAGRVVVVDSPARRARSDVLPADVELAVQERPTAPAGPSRPRWPSSARRLGRRRDGAGAQRRRAAGQRRGDRGAARRARAERRGRDDGDDRARGPERLRARRARRRRRASSGSSRPRPAATRRRRARDPRGQHRASTRSTRAALARRAAAPEHRQRAGRAVPAAGARPAARADGRRRGAPPHRRPRASCSASTTASRSRRCARLAQQAIHERHMLAGVTIVDPARDGDRRRRRDRRRTP